MSKRICLYCYKEYNISDLKMYCIKCEKDFSINQLKWQDKASFKIGSLPKLNYCIHCGKTKRSNIQFKCTTCNQSLSRDIIELKNKVISIIGGRGSGKTIYISLLIDFIENNIKLGNNQTFIRMEGDKRKDDILTVIQDRIKIEKGVPDPTEPKELKSEESTAGLPLIYFYKNAGETIALSFYDSAGEDLQNFDTLQQEYDYILNSSGIVFIMDIFSGIKNFRSTKNTLIHLIKLLRLEHGLNRSTKISIPISFVFNKFDLYSDESLEERHILWDGNNNEIILEEINKLHNSLSKHFKSNSIEGLGNLLEICSDNFINYKFIPVSSLGYNPLDNQLTNKIKPFDIEYPYIYLLDKI